MKLLKTTIEIFFLILLNHAVNAQHNDNLSVNDSSKWVGSFALALGNESKVAILLPKFYYVKKHYQPKFDFYYGGSAGIHPLLITGFVTGSAVMGIEIKKMDFETSISQFWHFGVPETETTNGIEAFGQTLWNFKIGYRIKKIRLRLGYSLILGEQNLEEQERIPLLDIGTINNHLYGLEFMIDI